MDPRALLDELIAYGEDANAHSGVRIRGRAPVPVELEYVRDIRPEDLAVLDAPRPTGQPPTVQRLRDSHHAAARAFALGETPQGVAAITGYSGAYLSILQRDPAFQGLVHHYRVETNAGFADVQARANLLTLDAMSVVAERLAERPDEVTLMQAQKIAEAWADRTGHGPSSKSVNVNVNVELATRLQRARERAALPVPSANGSAASVRASPENVSALAAPLQGVSPESFKQGLPIEYEEVA